MKACYCDVIGCMRNASWTLRDPASCSCEDNICGAHWDALHAHCFVRAYSYGRLPGTQFNLAKLKPLNDSAPGAQEVPVLCDKGAGFGRALLRQSA